MGTLACVGSAGKKRKGRRHLAKVRGGDGQLADGRNWFGGGYLGAKPWTSGRPSPYIRPPWLIVVAFTVVLVGGLYGLRQLAG